MRFAFALLAFPLGAGIIWSLLPSEEQEVAASLKAARQLIAASNKEKLVLGLTDSRRTQWSFVPGMRPGIALAEMSASQKEAAKELLQASLSESGFARVEAIRAMEPILAELERNPGRDPDRYWFVIFGEPGEKGFWSWRYEGHHLSLTFSYRDGKYASSTPQFLGSNPTDRGGRAMRLEEELGRAFVKALDVSQRKTAVIADQAPFDIVTSNQRKVSMLEDKGLAFTAMSADQQKKLRELVELYASILKPAAREQRLTRIKDWDKLKFAWMGGLEPGQGHYYRIQGPTFVIEYDNTQGGASHIHTVWRDFDSDFGADALEEHYRNSNHHRSTN